MMPVRPVRVPVRDLVLARLPHPGHLALDVQRLPREPLDGDGAALDGADGHGGEPLRSVG